jgi:hypothetical protein
MTKLENFTLEELMIFTVSILGAIGGLLTVIFKSKCKTIDCCCIKCVRDVDAVIKEEKIMKGLQTPRKPADEEKIELKEPEAEPETIASP